MLQTVSSSAVQKAVLAQVGKGGYQAPAVASLRLDMVGQNGPLAFAGNVSA